MSSAETFTQHAGIFRSNTNINTKRAGGKKKKKKKKTADDITIF